MGVVKRQRPAGRGLRDTMARRCDGQTTARAGGLATSRRECEGGRGLVVSRGRHSGPRGLCTNRVRTRTSLAARLGDLALAPGWGESGRRRPWWRFVEVSAYYVPGSTTPWTLSRRPPPSPQRSSPWPRNRTSAVHACTETGNPLVATSEMVGSVALSLLGLLAPLLAAGVVAILLVLLVRRVGRLFRERRRARRA